MTEFVQVAVPKHRVLEVYALLASESENDRHPISQKKWNDDLLRLAYDESPDGPADVIEYLSDRPDVIVTSQELSAGIGRTGQQLAGVLGAFGRRVKNRYHMESWPFEAWKDAKQGTMVYRMDARTAELIRTMREETLSDLEPLIRALARDFGDLMEAPMTDEG